MTEKEMNIELKIRDYINRLGITPNLVGYHYIKTAVTLCINDFSMITSITKALYPAVAEIYNVKSHNVGRCIRNAIDTASYGVPSELMCELFFNNGCKKPPTNSVFLATLTDRINLELMIENVKR